MKKIIIVLILGVGLITGCGNSNQKYKDLLKDYSKTYYEKYMMGVENQQQVEITLEMLKKGNENGDEYNLKELEKCKDSTTITLSLNNKEIIDYKYDLKCD